MPKRNYSGDFHQSYLDLYLRCPRKFYFRVICGLKPEGTHPAVAAGTATHELIAALHKEFPGEGELMRGTKDEDLISEMKKFLAAEESKLSERGSPVLWQNRDEEFPAIVLEYAQMVSAYCADPINSHCRVIAIESNFILDVDKYRFRGRIDQLRETDDGLVLVDLKTSSRRPDQDYLNMCYQFGVYCLAVQQGAMFLHDNPDEALTFGRIPDSIAWYHLRDYQPYKRATTISLGSNPESWIEWAKDQPGYDEESGKVKLQKDDRKGPGIYYTGRTQDELNSLVKDVRRICGQIRMGIFPRSVVLHLGSNNCSGCQHLEVCRMEDETKLSSAEASQMAELAEEFDY